MVDDTTVKGILWLQFGASIDTLRQAIEACPVELWGDQSRFPQYWAVAFHTAFWLDFYLTGVSEEQFAPPAPFGKEEFDPAGVLPPRVYSQQEVLGYLAFCREKCRAFCEGMTDESARRRFRSGWMDFSMLEVQLYNMRHVQHHAAQLNLILRQVTDSAPGWVSRARERPPAIG